MIAHSLASSGMTDLLPKPSRQHLVNLENAVRFDRTACGTDSTWNGLLKHSVMTIVRTLRSQTR